MYDLFYHLRENYLIFSIQNIFRTYLSFLPTIDIIYHYRQERFHRRQSSRIYAIQRLVDAP